MKKVKWFKLFWEVHKWAGVIVAVWLLNVSVTGFLLLYKGKWDWVQPPTLPGAPGEPRDFISYQQLFEIVFSQDHPDFQELGDIDRVNFRPEQRNYTVWSRRNYTDLQVCAVTGEVLSLDFRTNNLLEDIHDGQFFGEFLYTWISPLVALVLSLLVFTGLYLWLEPKFLRKRRKRAPPDPAAVRAPAGDGPERDGREPRRDPDVIGTGRR